MTADRARMSTGARGSTPASTARDVDVCWRAASRARMRSDECFWVHDIILDEYRPLLGADAFAIYCSLSCMANKEQYYWPSFSRLARRWGKGGRHGAAVTLLFDLKLIHVQRGMNQDERTERHILPVGAIANSGRIGQPRRRLPQQRAHAGEDDNGVVALVPQNSSLYAAKCAACSPDSSLLLNSSLAADPEHSAAAMNSGSPQKHPAVSPQYHVVHQKTR